MCSDWCSVQPSSHAWHTYAQLNGTGVLDHRPTSSVCTNLQRPETAISTVMYMRYDTETYVLEIVFTFWIDPSLSSRSKLPHGFSSVKACGVLFLPNVMAARQCASQNFSSGRDWISLKKSLSSRLILRTPKSSDWRLLASYIDNLRAVGFETLKCLFQQQHERLHACIWCYFYLFTYLLVFILWLLLFDLDIIIAHNHPKNACSVEIFEREWLECTPRKFPRWTAY